MDEMRTPWGTAAELQEQGRSARRGPSRKARARSQRERIYGAMVLATARMGYGTVRVADVIELAGVSRSTFYQHFENKGECFRATVQIMLGAGLADVRKVVYAQSDWETVAEAALRSVLDLIVEQPVAARVCLIDAYTAGPDGVEPVEKTLNRVALVVQAALARLSGQSEVPPGAGPAVVGGFHKVIYEHLRKGEQESLPSMVGELIEWATCLLDPRLGAMPRRGSRLRRPCRREPVPAEAYDQHQRILRGFAAAVVERGYGRTTISQIAAKASISQTSFYQHFRDREDAFMAALDLSGAHLVAAALPAARRAEDWPAGLRIAVAGICRYLANEPDFARLHAIEAYAAGPDAVAVRDRALNQTLAELLPTELRQDQEQAIEASCGAFYALLYEKVRHGHLDELNQLVPLATYLLLCPLLGSDEAATVALG